MKNMFKNISNENILWILSLERRTWGAMLTSGQAAFRAILILSEREEVAAWAQQLPQY